MVGDDVKMLARMEPVVRRVLIVDAQGAAARLLADVMKGMGAREVIFEVDEKAAMEVARDYEPTLMFVERSGPRFDGESLVMRLRRSRLAARQIPIIMITAEATATTIKGARDAGVHEFMVKPFTTGDLVRRVVNVATKPRPWVEAVQYVGPDRRRFNSGEYKGPRKRQVEAASGPSGLHEDVDQAGKIILAALNQFNMDPAQARRAIIAQGEILKSLAPALGQPHLAAAAADMIAVAGLDAASADGIRAKAMTVLSVTSEAKAGKSAA